jgi:hypothetical protein
MATAEPTPGSAPVSHEPQGDDWVAHIVADPMDVPAVVLVFGFVGKASKDEHVRIYLTPTLSHLCEIPASAIVHRQPLPRAQFPLGGSYFWIAAEAWAGSAVHYVVPPPAACSAPVRP